MVAMVEVGRPNEYFLSFLPTVNSPPVPHRDLSAAPNTYRPYHDEYAAVQRQPRPEEVKKDKKWSIGKLFRRKKKEEESESSSSDDVSGSPSKKKGKKKKRAPLVNNFDHIVIRDTRRAQSLAKPSIHQEYFKDDGVLSDPSAEFLHKKKIQEPYESKEYLDLRPDTRVSTTVLETPGKKKRKSRLKARVEALRNSIRGESSSDEESLKSSNSSSIVRFRSEDSLMRSRDSSLNKRSRSARNERYIKRLSRDEENQLNKEAELLHQGYTKAEVELLTRTPTSQSSGYGTCKRDPHNNIKPELNPNDFKKGTLKSDSISSFPSNQSYLSSINFNAKVNNDHINYSIQCASNNSNRESLYANTQREGSLSNQYENPESVICVKFPLGSVPVKKEERSPPVPPPRDMQRKVVTPLSMYYDNNSDRTNNSHNFVHGVPNNDFERIMRRSQERSYGTSGLRRPISNSEDHIAMQNNEFMQHYLQTNEQPRRPASVSAEPNHYGIFSNSNTPPWRRRVEQPSARLEPSAVQTKQDYLYYADQSPRSRRPISIKNGLQQNQYLSDSQASFNVPESVYKKPRNASDFWRKIDDAERLRQQQGVFANTRSNSDNTHNDVMYRSFSERSKPTNKLHQTRAVSVDSCNRNKSYDLMDGAKIWKATTEYKQSEPKDSAKSEVKSPTKTHVRHKSDTYGTGNGQIISDEEKNSERRKSTNLDDALNELEAIYNSLGLGDEDLLDRAERRELMTPKFNEHYNDWNGNDDNISLRSQPTTPLRRIPRRSTLPDKLQDDMAFRRMNSFNNKDKPNPKEVQSQISYMLASPVYVPYASDDDKCSERNEPDIVHDDVVYRNIKQTNNRLKTIDPQPPFGIPVGPISPAPQSDYLHAIPENKGRPRFVPKRSPDLVADDLAYRSLRKDNRNSSLFNNDDYGGLINNNPNSEYPYNKDVSNIKKKRAVRSLSANIFTMIQKEIDDALKMTKAPTLQKTNSNSDVMRRLRETFENNDNNSRDHYPRNKVKQRHNTVNLFVNNPPTPSHTFTRDDSFIHADDTCLAKSSSCDKSKNSSPLNKSPQTSKRSSKDEFQHVLSMLAQEAMDTSNKLGVALAELDKNRNKNETANIQSRISSSRQDFLNGLTEKSYNNNSSAVMNVNDYSKVKEPQPVLDNAENNSRGKNTEDSLLVISDQISKVEEQLKSSVERDSESRNKDNHKSPDEVKWPPCVSNINDAFSESKNISNIVSKPLYESNQSNNIFYENTSNDKSEISVPKTKSTNPFINNDEVVKELNEIKAFKELKDGIKDLIAGISEVNDKLFVNKKTTKTDDTIIENTVSKDKTDANINENKTQTDGKNNRTSFTPSIYENDKRDDADTEYNSSEELATIFKFDVQPPAVENVKEKREDLSSPKIVKTMNQHLRRLSVDEGTSSQSPPPTNVVPWRTKPQGNNEKQQCDWHSSGTMMLACSYTLMLSQHLADLDWLTLLGLLLAIVTIIAMLMI
ncbi:homeobox protein 2-like isoform X2 [Aricia agestis]|uniref:homeobox protein 2-like isoform X2 n=1 Tax=Aricia agestis TaxID=91739 RepID=UPI001C206CD4|nr:homeobox protein 2-like isoform X2 [Aricia agestis]